MNRLGAIFRGGVISGPGVPLLLGGCNDKTVVRAVIELGKWLNLPGDLCFKKTWDLISEEITNHATVGLGNRYVTEVFPHNMPASLFNTEVQRSWVSGGWTTPCGARPLSQESENKIICTFISELNGRYGMDLCPEPSTDRMIETQPKVKPKFLCIGGSHAKREGKLLSDMGYEVITCAVAGWRPNKSAALDMAARVEEALQHLTEDDIVVVHCFDNVSYMARSEEGGDLPIRKFVTGDYHVEGDLVLASKERLHMFFVNCLPVLKLLENRKVIILSPLPRYLYVSCCGRADHAPNRLEDGFEDSIRKSLQEVRNYYKDFLFTNGLRGFVILNPGHCVPFEDEEGAELWGMDPVHPLQDGYRRIAAMICEEADKLLHKTEKRKREGGSEPASKKPRVEAARPRWVEDAVPSATMQMGPPRGRGGGQGRGRRPWGQRGGNRGNRFVRGFGYCGY
jgi:hypothetical protein